MRYSLDYDQFEKSYRVEPAGQLMLLLLLLLLVRPSEHHTN